MDPIYENSAIILSTVPSEGNISQHKGNSRNIQESEREVNTSKGTKVLLIVLSVSLVCAVGGLCVLGMLYIRASMQLSPHETNSKMVMRELTVVKEQLSFYEALTAQSSNCDVNMTVFQGKLYFFSSDKLNWSSSRAFCISKGANLVTVTSQSEQLFLHSKIKEWYWIGLSDLETEGRWVWVNNQTLNDTGVEFWFKRQSEKSEPDDWKEDDPSGEDCAIVRNDVNSLNSWFDGSCKYTRKFICEKTF